MPAPALITRADLEERFPPQHVRGVFRDDGASEPGPRLAVACAVATRQAEAVLLKAWSLEQMAGLVAEDEAIKSALCDLAMAEGVKGKPEWMGEGRPYATLRKDALTTLEMLAKAELRTRAERTVGANPNRRGNVGSGDCRAFTFAPARDGSRRGGY
jgi:hypothetical protein